MPFSISADTNMPDPFVAINVNLYQIEYERMQELYFNGLNGLTPTSARINSATLTQQNYGCQTMTDYDVSSGVDMECDRYVSSGTGSIGQHTFTFTLPNNIFSQNINDTTYYITEFDFILNKSYTGTFTFSYKYNNGSTQSVDLGVNGDHVTYKVQGNPNLFSDLGVGNIDLTVSELVNSWLFPIESYPYVFQINNAGFEQVGFTDYSNYLYPIYKNDPSKYIARFVGNCYVIMGIYSSNISTIEQFNNNFTYNSGYTLSEIKTIFAVTGFRIIKVKFDQTSGNLNLKMTPDINFIPIYIGGINNTNLSVDFALNYGLTNRMIDDIYLIAHGNDPSNQSVDDASDQLDETNAIFEDYDSIEQDFNQDMNDSLDNIDMTTGDPTGFGSKFQTSANWVAMQFNRMTSTTPFGSILSFSLLLGLSLLIIGKVFG